MKREIESHPAVVEPITDCSISDVKVWLQTQAVQHNLRWLLAHADDGVIWGELRNGQLVTSESVAPEVSPPLRAETLQQVRLFATRAELLLWRDGDNRWHARLIRDAGHGEKPTFTDAIDEPQILWGTDPQPLANGFTLMSDGAQGLRHAVPLDVRGRFDESSRPLRLWVRHYLQDDESGFTRIVASRLFDLKLEEVK
ncbi:CRISPR-associated protein Csx19 [Thermogutta sp.]|uniref:type III-D CRISPR-associated protein Csx19 n=1 Tax=Thermogutta sp. TaxID=1962930 RepID=UPI0025EA3112|nr:CRISPR-associated protein Csx19 [Thermogutta sp.]